MTGAWDPGYPRNRIVRAALAHAGHQVQEVRVRERRAWLRYPALAARFGRDGIGSDVVWVPEFRHKDVVVARLLAGARPLLFDPLVSRWDTLVGDWQLHRAGGLQARWNRAIDRWSFRAADRVLCDTWAHGELFVELGARRSQLRRLLVGAEEMFFEVGPPPSIGPVRILYVGGFLPLHGIRTILDAAARLERMALPEFELLLAGRGIEWDAARAFVEREGLRRVRFTGATPYVDAPRLFEQSHITLGAFGTGGKAARVIPHKLWQGLAAGRAVVTGDGPGVREVFRDHVHLRLVPCGDGEALSEVLAEWVRDRAAREQYGRAAHVRASETGRVTVLADATDAIIREVAA